MIEHKGYIGTVEHDPASDDLVGQVINIDGAITYRGRSIDELRARMVEAIDSYLTLCQEHDIEPRRPYSGRLNLRMDPVLHARVAAAAESTGRSINQVIVDALQRDIAS